LGGSEAGKKPGTQESSGLNEKRHIMEFGRSPILMQIYSSGEVRVLVRSRSPMDLPFRGLQIELTWPVAEICILTARHTTGLPQLYNPNTGGSQRCGPSKSAEIGTRKVMGSWQMTRLLHPRSGYVSRALPL
jgi:hypothetical protein